MRVLLVSPNREQLPDPVFPIGLAYISSSLKQGGHDVDVLDLCFSQDREQEIRERLHIFRPDVIGMSLRNIDDVAYPKKHSYLEEYREAVSAVRRYSDAPVVLGGSGFTIMPEAFMAELNADYGIAGEGERAFPELLKRIGKDKAVRGTISSARSRISDIGRTVPDRDVFDGRSYYRLGGMLNIQTKRGCPFRCIYCTYPKIEGRRVRVRSPRSVGDEIEQVREQTGARHFFIVDSIFNYPVSHAEAVCDEIIRRRLDIRWSCYANPACMTGRLAERMAQAGCTGVEFGTDSLVDEGLSAVGKNFTFDTIKGASALCRNNGLKFCHFIFIGGPGDDEKRVWLNLERLDALAPDAAVLMAGIRIFPDTGLAARARKELGISGISLEPVFYLSPGVRDLAKVSDEIAKRRNWVMPGLEINLHPRLQKKLREHGIKGPLWEELAKRR